MNKSYNLFYLQMNFEEIELILADLSHPFEH
jgi:hypothetical protein